MIQVLSLGIQANENVAAAALDDRLEPHGHSALACCHPVFLVNGV